MLEVCSSGRTCPERVQSSRARPTFRGIGTPRIDSRVAICASSGRSITSLRAIPTAVPLSSILPLLNAAGNLMIYVNNPGVHRMAFQRRLEVDFGSFACALSGSRERMTVAAGWPGNLGFQAIQRGPVGGGRAAGELAVLVDEVSLVVIAAIEGQAGERVAAGQEAPLGVAEAQHARQEFGRQAMEYERKIQFEERYTAKWDKPENAQAAAEMADLVAYPNAL